MKRRKFVLAVGSAVAATRAKRSLASSANEQIRVACIGTGGRCRHLMQALGKISGAKIVGICDVWDEALKAAKPLAAPDAFVEKDYRRTLERKDVDAVLIATPDHWHVPLVIAALEAGKDVYCEKPLTHKISEATQLLDVHKRHPRVVQVGTQQRSMPHLQEARELVRSGKLGQVFKADLSWNRNIGRGISQPKVDPNSVDWKMFLGNAPDQPFNAYRMREWRWIWDFGGGLFTDLMVHWLDVVHWFCEVETPTLALSFGDWIHAKGHWETPDTVQTLLHYPGTDKRSLLQAHYEGTFSNAHRAAMTVFMGTEATLYVDRGRFEFIPERGKSGALTKIIANNPKSRGADFYDQPDGERLHLENWLDCIRSRKETTAPLKAGVSAALAAQLANMALRGKGMAMHAPT